MFLFFGFGMLFITLGDPLSVNVELLAHSLPDLARLSAPVMVIGSKAVFEFQIKRYEPLSVTFAVGTLGVVPQSGLHFIDVDPGGHGDATKMSEIDRGRIATLSLSLLRHYSWRRVRHAVLTMPIDKHAAERGGFTFGGQTEFFGDLWGDPGVMLLAGPKLRVGLVTNHAALRDVPGLISASLVKRKAIALASGLHDLFGIARPRIAVTGLNPHAGDQGLFGDEEDCIIKPAVAELQSLGLSAEFVGPVPADTAFYRAYTGAFDAVLAMYHDQGLGPIKTVHFDDAVNITAGLPHLRVSPDHGPAKDLFQMGLASTASFDRALDLACRYIGESRP